MRQKDITQDTFLKLYIRFDDLKGGNVSAWLFTTAKHAALNYKEKHSREILSMDGEDPPKSHTEKVQKRNIQKMNSSGKEQNFTISVYRTDGEKSALVRCGLSGILHGDTSGESSGNDGYASGCSACFTEQSKKMDKKNLWRGIRRDEQKRLTGINQQVSENTC